MTEKPNNNFTALSTIKNCTRCGRELEQGYIIIKASWWNENTPDSWWKFGTRNKQLTQIGTWQTPSFPALRCKQCHFVTFDYTSALQRGAKEERRC